MKRVILTSLSIGLVLYATEASGAWIEGGNPIPSAFTNMIVYDTPGTYIWTVPDGVYKIKVELWGGGGAGNYYSSSYYSVYCGGGAGGYGLAIIDVTPSTPCAITVGRGGTSAGANGENTTITCGSITYTAYGGKGAYLTSSSCHGGEGGGATTPFSIKGMSGGVFYYNSSSQKYIGATIGGFAPRGGAGAFYYNPSLYVISDSSYARFPGGGGFYGAPLHIKGANGAVIIWY